MGGREKEESPPINTKELYQMLTLYTLNLHNTIYHLYLNKSGGEEK